MRVELIQHTQEFCTCRRAYRSTWEITLEPSAPTEHYYSCSDVSTIRKPRAERRPFSISRLSQRGTTISNEPLSPSNQPSRQEWSPRTSRWHSSAAYAPSVGTIYSRVPC